MYKNRVKNDKKIRKFLLLHLVYEELTRVRKIQNNKKIFDFDAPFYAEFRKIYGVFSTLFSNKYGSEPAKPSRIHAFAQHLHS